MCIGVVSDSQISRPSTREEAAAEVLHLLGGGAVGHALERVPHLQADRLEGAAQDAEGDRVDAPGGLAHAASSRSMMIAPSGSTRAVVPGGTTVVESSCSTMAGPAMTLPARSALRS